MRGDDWAALRDLRLRALQGSPESYMTTHAEAAAQDESRWRELARRGAAGDRQATFVDEAAGELVGMATGIGREGETVPESWVQLIQMWVDPDSRRRGIGRALVDAVVRWATEIGAPCVRLGANERVVAAVMLYRACGFSDTGEREHYRDETAIVMERRLGDRCR